MVAVGNQPAAARNLISPFPVSPSGGKPGRAGSPHAGSTSHASKQRWHVPMPPAPPTRGAKPPLCIPPVDTTSFRLTTTGLLMEAATRGSGQENRQALRPVRFHAGPASPPCIIY